MSIQKCVTGAECKLQRKTGTCGWTVSKKMQACLLNQHEQAMEELDSIVQGGGRKRKGGAVVKANYGITSTSSSKKARLASAAVKNNSFRTTSNTDSPLPIGMLDDRIALLLKKKEQQQLVKRDLTSDSEGHTSSYEEEFGVPIGMIDESLEKYTKKSSTARRLPSSSSGFTVSQATAQKLIDQLQQHQKIGAIDGSLVARKSKKQPKDLKHLLKHY